MGRIYFISTIAMSGRIGATEAVESNIDIVYV